MNKTITYVSLLKPISDPRATKILESLKQHFPQHKYHLIATEDKQPTSQQENIVLHPLSKTLTRKEKRRQALEICKKISTDIILFNNIDFYWCSILKLSKTAYIYDIRENYSKNVQFQNHYKGFTKHILPHFIKTLEFFASKLITGTVLAEKCYEEELKNRISANYTVIENKSKLLTFNPTQKRNNFLISGTLSEEYGTIDAINWFIDYQKQNKEATLTVIGKTSSKKLEEKINLICNQHHNITNHISTYPIPNKEINSYIHNSDIGLLPYQNNPCFDNKNPTKLYDYLCAGKLIISQRNHRYNALLDNNKNALIIDFQDKTTHTLSAIHSKLQHLEASPAKDKLFWKSDESKLVLFFNKLLN